MRLVQAYPLPASLEPLCSSPVPTPTLQPSPLKTLGKPQQLSSCFRDFPLGLMYHGGLLSIRHHVELCSDRGWGDNSRVTYRNLPTQLELSSYCDPSSLQCLI